MAKDNLKRNLLSMWVFFLSPICSLSSPIDSASIYTDSLTDILKQDSPIRRERYQRIGRCPVVNGKTCILPNRNEILAAYQAHPEQIEHLSGYEYYELLDMVKDPAQKEVLAKAAMKLVKEPDGERPYALAAYELAQCYLQRGITDTLLLKPYLDWYLPPEREKVDHNGQSKGWFNDKAIMATQLIMYIKSQNYTAADNVYTYLYSLVQTGCHSLGCCREIFKKNGRYYWKSGCELDSQGQPVRHSKTCSRERQINELWKKIKNIYEQRTQP